MKFDFLPQLIAYTVPAVVTGLVAYFYFSEFVKNQAKKDIFLMHNHPQKDTLGLKLQAYERLSLFLERSDLKKVVVRIAPIATEKHAYESLLMQHIEQEYEYNLSQQIYISEELWAVITQTKNNIIQAVRQIAQNPQITQAQQLREALIKESFSDKNSSQLAMTLLKREVREVIGS